MSAVSYVNGNLTDNLIVIKSVCISIAICHDYIMNNVHVDRYCRKTDKKYLKCGGETAVGCPANSGGGLSRPWPVLLPVEFGLCSTVVVFWT